MRNSHFPSPTPNIHVQDSNTPILQYSRDSRSKLRAQSAFFNPRVVIAFALCSVGVGLGMLSFASTPPNGVTGSAANSAVVSSFVDEHVGTLGIKAIPVTATR